MPSLIYRIIIYNIQFIGKTTQTFWIIKNKETMICKKNVMLCHVMLYVKYVKETMSSMTYIVCYIICITDNYIGIY